MRQDRSTQGPGGSGLVPTTSTASLGSQLQAEKGTAGFSERRSLLVWRQVEQRSDFQEILWVWVRAVQPRGHGRCHILHTGHPHQQLDLVLFCANQSMTSRHDPAASEKWCNSRGFWAFLPILGIQFNP